MIKKIFILSTFVFFAFFLKPDPVRAEQIFQQPGINGYLFTDTNGFGFFCDNSSSCTQYTAYNMSPGLLTNFEGSHAFSVPEGRVIGSVTLSLAKVGEISDPGHLVMWCDDPNESVSIKSTQLLTNADLETGAFKSFQFDFPRGNCKAMRGLYFDGPGGGWGGLQIQASNKNNFPNYGMGNIQNAGVPLWTGTPTGFESFEPYIQISDAPPYVPLKQQVCDMGYESSDYAQAGIPIPTYDYDPTDGLVKFHFKGLSGYNGPFTYRRYDDYCKLLYPVLWSTKGDFFGYSVAAQNVMFKAKEVKDESGNLMHYTWEAYNEDSGELLPSNYSNPSFAFNDPIISIGYFSYTGYPGYPDYIEYNFFSPAVLVKDPNFKPLPTKTPVLIIPGTLGTEISKGEEKLWMDINRMKNPFDGDAFMNPLAFNEDGTPLDTSLLMGDVLTRPDPSFDYLEGLISDLATNNYKLNQNLFLLPYDWRDKIEKNADVLLSKKINDILSSTTSPKLDVIAHSQGGLLIKRLLYDMPEYQSKINKLVFVGTPNLGSPKTVKILTYGDDLGINKFGISLLEPLEIKKISRNMPAIYQMLPSREYFNHSPGYLGEYSYGPIFTSAKVINGFEDTKNSLKKPVYNLNSDLIDQANTFHTTDFDNMDLSNSGIKAFNIMGCESPTLSQIYINGTGGKEDIKYAPGDGTVPLVSASNINGAQNFYFLNQEQIHSTMLTSDGIRQKIVNLIADTKIFTEGKITSNPALCVFKGKKVEVHSPVDLHIYDESGNHTGPNSSGGFDYQIKNIAYDEIEHSKYAFLPDDGHSYTVKFIATGSGAFNFYSSFVEGEETKSLTYYNDIPVSTSSVARVVFNAQNDQKIEFLTESRIVRPSSILGIEMANDVASPISTSTLSGLMGQLGMYHSDVIINIFATDSIIVGQENQTSGVLKTMYSLDGAEYEIYTSLSPVTVLSEGSHQFSFYSVDRAGNIEPKQTINFVIDKTAPEIVAQFNTTKRDFEFLATDNLDPNPTIICTQTKCTATDQAGNISVLNFQKVILPLNIKNLILKNISYNGAVKTFDQNLFTLAYIIKAGVMTSLSQTELIKNKQILNITYNSSKKMSVITDFTKGLKPVITNQPGIILLQVLSNKGIINTIIK